MTDHWIEASNLGVAWSRAVTLALNSSESEVTPLAVSLVGFDENGVIDEDADLRASLDSYLRSTGRQAVRSVANTIFPSSLWNPRHTRSNLFDRYLKLLPRIRKASPKNRRGIYF
jgi:hypothetical protein